MLRRRWTLTSKPLLTNKLSIHLTTRVSDDLSTESEVSRNTSTLRIFLHHSFLRFLISNLPKYVGCVDFENLQFALFLHHWASTWTFTSIFFSEIKLCAWVFWFILIIYWSDGWKENVALLHSRIIFFCFSVRKRKVLENFLWKSPKPQKNFNLLLWHDRNPMSGWENFHWEEKKSHETFSLGKLLSQVMFKEALTTPLTPPSPSWFSGIYKTFISSMSLLFKPKTDDTELF